jgi:futalosine hydrolase
MSARDVLLVAATERELGGHEGLACGIGPVEAAAATARTLAERRPGAVLHVGLAGGAGLAAGTLVLGTESVYADIAADIPVVSRLAADRRLVAAIGQALPEAPRLPIATSARVSESGSRAPQGYRVEAMEGFAVLRASELAGVPAVEVRVISNELGEDDRSRWQLELGFETLAAALPMLLAAIRE